jgi:peptidoglycan/xylan/chitin deacetylase (PgdA/CDA1 family)
MSVRRIALRAVKWASVASDPILGRRQGPRILLYHQIGSGSGLEMDVTPEAFRSQLDWLLSNGRAVDLATAVTGKDNADSGDQYVVTLDDGHLGVYEHAYPALLEQSIPFTLYLTTEPLEGDGFLHDDSRMPLLSWAQITEMMSSGLMTVGAHSHRHLDMRRHDAMTIRQDLEACDRVLETRVGIRPQHFAYPWGHWSSVADRLIRQRYTTAVVGGGRSVGTGADLHRLGRIPVMASDSAALFRRKMWGGFRLETVLRDARDSFSR